MAAAVVNKAVIVNVRATAHDHLRDHPCHPPHGRQRGSEEEEDHVQARLSPAIPSSPQSRSVSFATHAAEQSDKEEEQAIQSRSTS